MSDVKKALAVVMLGAGLVLAGSGSAVASNWTTVYFPTEGECNGVRGTHLAQLPSDCKPSDSWPGFYEFTYWDGIVP